MAGAALAVAVVASLLQQLFLRYQFPSSSSVREHMALAGIIVILGVMQQQHRFIPWMLHGVILVAFSAANYYFIYIWDRSGLAPTDDYLSWVFTSFLIGPILFLVYRFFGLAFAVLGLFFIFYAFFADAFPGVLEGPQNDLWWTFRRLSDSSFGQPFGLAAEFIWLLVFWGQMLTVVGAAPFVHWISRRLANSTAGGAALGATLSSALVGSFTGAGAYNVVVTGPVTIPSMRRSGYTGEMAGAIEAVASNGAAITPPVLGSVAFVMANLLNLPFILIVVMTIVPAFLWYLSVGLHLMAHARKHGIISTDEPDESSVSLRLRSVAITLLPISLLVYMVGTNRPLEDAVFYTFVATVALALIVRIERRWRVVWKEAKDAAVTASAVSLTLAVLALVINVMAYTALGSRLDELIEVVSGGYALIALGLMIVVSAILAGPLPPVAVYLIMVVTFAPVLTQMGVPYQASHFVAFYMGSLGTIVPPIAQSTLMASVIANVSYMRTNLAVLKLAWPLFALPVLFVAAPELLLVAGGPSDVGKVLGSVGLAIIAYAFAALATVGWLFVSMGFGVRVMGAAVPLLVFWALQTDDANFAFAAMIVAGLVCGKQWWSYLGERQSQGLNPFANGAIAGVSVRAMRGIGYVGLGSIVVLGFAWLVLVVSPIAPVKMFQHVSGIDQITQSVNTGFFITTIGALVFGGFFLGLAKWRSKRMTNRP